MYLLHQDQSLCVIICIGEVIRGNVVAAVRKTKFFALCTNELTDIFYCKQMPMVVHYVVLDMYMRM